MITSPKGVKRKLDKIPKDEGEEQFVSEEDEIGVPPDEADGDPNDEISDRKDNHMAGEGASTGEEDTTHGEVFSVVKLADVCRDDDDVELKKDVKFINGMGVLLLNYEASNKLMPMYVNMQRQYIKARQNVKESLAAKGNKEPQKQRANEMEQEEQEDEYINAFDFLNNFQC